MSEPPSPPSAPAPGHSAPGQGGPYHPNDDERTMGMLIHITAVLAGFICPLILWLLKREGSQFIDHNGKEALNFQITIFLITMPLTFGGIFLVFVTQGWAALVVFPLVILIGIGALVLEVRSGLKAHRGGWPRYPICIRILK